MTPSTRIIHRLIEEETPSKLSPRVRRCDLVFARYKTGSLKGARKNSRKATLEGERGKKWEDTR